MKIGWPQVFDHQTRCSRYHGRILSATLLALAIACQFSACVRVYVAADMSQTGNPEADDSEQEVPLELPCFLKSQVPGANQKTGSWCWAASAQLVVEYLTGVAAPQCELVSDVFVEKLKDHHHGQLGQPVNCCDWLNNGAGGWRVAEICDQGGWPELALRERNIHFDKKDQAQGPLEWRIFTDEICADRPFIFVVGWKNGGRHSAVGGGYQTTQHFGSFVEVYDHSPDEFYVMPLREFQGGGNFVHEYDYINLQLD